MATFGTRWSFPLLLFEDFTLGVIITVTGLTAQAGMLPQSVTGNTFVCFCLKNLAACLVLKLVIFTEEVLTEGATEDSPTMIPDTTITLDAVCIRQGTGTCVSAQTFSPVADPGFTEVAHCPHHGHPCAVDSWMLNDTVRGFHTLRFTTLSTNGQLLH